MKKLSEVAIDHPFVTLGLGILTTLFFATQLRKLTIDPDITSALPKDLPAKQLYDRMGEIFPSKEFVFIAFESDSLFSAGHLATLFNITEKLEQHPGVYQVISPTNAKVIKGIQGGMEVKPLLQEIPQDSREVEAYYQRLISADVYEGMILSFDRRALGLLVFLRNDVDLEESVQEIIRIVDQLRGDLKVYYTGKPVVTYFLGKGIGSDMRVLFPLSLGVIFTILFLSFRSVRGVVLPLSVVMASVVWTLGLMSLTKVPLSHGTEFIAILILAIGVADGIHILSQYYLKAAEFPDKRSLVSAIMRDLRVPVILTSLTTMVGFLALDTSGVNTLMILGAFTAFGVGVALMFSLTLIPAGLILVKVPSRTLQRKRGGLAERLMVGYGKLLIRYRRVLPGLIVVVIIFSLWGMTRIRAESSSIENFHPDHPLRIAAEKIDEDFVGTTNLTIVVEGRERDAIKDPVILERMGALQDTLKTLPHVRKAQSIVDFIALMNQAMHEDNPAYRRVPNPVEEETVRLTDGQAEVIRVPGRELVSQYLQLYELSSKPDDFANLVDYDYRMAKITAFLDTDHSSALKSVDTALRGQNGLIERYFGDLPVEVELTGMGEIFLAVNRLIVTGQLKSLGVSLILVGLCTGLMFRSVIKGLFSALPLFFALFLNFALMGWAGIYLNLETMIIASIAIAIGVDYAIHFIHRYDISVKRTGSFEEGVLHTMRESGVAILLNALTVAIGFAVLLFSAFKGVGEFGLLIAIAMITACLGALTILPILFLMAKPKAFLMNPEEKGWKKRLPLPQNPKQT